MYTVLHSSNKKICNTDHVNSVGQKDVHAARVQKQKGTFSRKHLYFEFNFSLKFVMWKTIICNGIFFPLVVTDFWSHCIFRSFSSGRTLNFKMLRTWLCRNLHTNITQESCFSLMMGTYILLKLCSHLPLLIEISQVKESRTGLDKIR